MHAAQDAWQQPSAAEAEGGELASAQESLQEAEKSGTLKQSTSMESLMQVMTGKLAILTLPACRRTQHAFHAPAGGLYHLFSRVGGPFYAGDGCAGRLTLTTR